MEKFELAKLAKGEGDQEKSLREITRGFAATQNEGSLFWPLFRRSTSFRMNQRRSQNPVQLGPIINRL
jgi:hypothetical protein